MWLSVCVCLCELYLWLFLDRLAPNSFVLSLSLSPRTCDARVASAPWYAHNLCVIYCVGVRSLSDVLFVSALSDCLWPCLCAVVVSKFFLNSNEIDIDAIAKVSAALRSVALL